MVNQYINIIFEHNFFQSNTVNRFVGGNTEQSGLVVRVKAVLICTCSYTRTTCNIHKPSSLGCLWNGTDSAVFRFFTQKVLKPIVVPILPGIGLVITMLNGQYLKFNTQFYYIQNYYVKELGIWKRLKYQNCTG